MALPLAIQAERLSKKYRLGERLEVFTLREQISSGIRRRIGLQPRDVSSQDGVLWALRDASFSLTHGEVVGVIGANGAGKSTLLKILAKIVEPTAGRALIRGRVASLLEVGTGFHADLTGRENVFLNGAILGMRRSEIREAFDEIVAFAEVERFIDTPVKRYSSGMYVRLAFAVAAHLRAEILLVDEVLAVGDIGFQRKCLQKMNEVSTSGRTILFVSHNMGAISELCSRALLIERGCIAVDGSPSNAIDRYMRAFSESRAGVLPQDESLPVSFASIDALNSAGEPVSAFDLADAITIRIRYRVSRRIDGLIIVLTLARNAVEILHTYDCDSEGDAATRDAGEFEARYTIAPMFLKAGAYSVTLYSTSTHRTFQRIDSALTFEVGELSINTHHKGFRRDRPGHVISQGRWDTRRLPMVG